MAPEAMAVAADTLVRRADKEGGTVIAVSSPRTEPDVLEAISQMIDSSRHLMVQGLVPRYGTLLRDADEIYVTADSISMLSEAVFTGKPVGLIPLPMSRRGKWHYRLSDAGLLKPPARDLRKVRDRLLGEHLVGTIDAPVCGSVSDPVEEAAKAVLQLLTATSRQNPRP